MYAFPNGLSFIYLQCVSSMITTMLSYFLTIFVWKKEKYVSMSLLNIKLCFSFCIVPSFVCCTLLVAKLSEMKSLYSVLLMILNQLILFLFVNVITVYARLSFRWKIDDNFKHIFLKTSVTLYSLQQRASIEKNNGLHCPKWHLLKKRLDNNIIYEPIIHRLSSLSSNYLTLYICV